MKRLFFVLLFAVLGLFSSHAFAGTAYYVDCSSKNNGNGSFASPWNNIGSVNSHGFATGDDVYFKVNTTCTPSSVLIIDWDGEEGDRIIIGAYYGNGQFGLNGNDRPVIDGNNWTVPTPGKTQGLIMMQSQSADGYITIQDLRVNDSGQYGIYTRYVDNIIVDNCYVYRSRKNGIIIVQCDGGTISNNTVEQASYLTTPAAGLTINGADQVNESTNIIVRNNTVFHCYEGIGLYKRTSGCIVEYNHVYDNRSNQIYNASSANNIIRYNSIYGSSDWKPWKNNGDSTAPSNAIFLDVEAWKSYQYGGNNEIYGNLIAWTNKGIVLADNHVDFAHTNNKIYNNTIVDCNYSFYFGDNSGWSGNEIKNNISWTITAGTKHANNYSRDGVTWSHNLFDDSIGGNAASNAVIGDPQLSKRSGWRFLSPGAAQGTEWNLQETSPAKDNGMYISGHNDRINHCNYTTSPITVSISADSTPNIGAWTETRLVINELILFPSNLRLVR